MSFIVAFFHPNIARCMARVDTVTQSSWSFYILPSALYVQRVMHAAIIRSSYVLGYGTQRDCNAE